MTEKVKILERALTLQRLAGVNINSGGPLIVAGADTLVSGFYACRVGKDSLATRTCVINGAMIVTGFLHLLKIEPEEFLGDMQKMATLSKKDVPVLFTEFADEYLYPSGNHYQELVYLFLGFEAQAKQYGGDFWKDLSYMLEGPESMYDYSWEEAEASVKYYKEFAGVETEIREIAEGVFQPVAVKECGQVPAGARLASSSQEPRSLADKISPVKH